MTIGPDGKITDVNAATEAATGPARAELIGTDFCDYFTEPEKARDGYDRVFREGSSRTIRLNCGIATVKSPPSSTTPRYTAMKGGQVVGVAAVRDVTQRKSA